MVNETGNTQNEADLPQRAPKRTADDYIGCVHGTEVLDARIDGNREFGQVATNRKDDNTDDELRDAESFGDRDRAADGCLGAEPETCEAGK